MLKDKTTERKVRDDRLRKRIRERVQGTPERPRLHVFKSNSYIYTQVIDDRKGAVLLTASTLALVEGYVEAVYSLIARGIAGNGSELRRAHVALRQAIQVAVDGAE